MIVIEFDRKETKTLQLIKVSEININDDKINDLIQMELDQTSLWLDQSICKVINGDYLIKDPYNDRINKHPIFSFINQVMKDKAHTQLSSCGLSIEAIGFNKQITVRDVLALSHMQIL